MQAASCNAAGKKEKHMQTQLQKLQFASDYMEGAHPHILKKLMETNLMQTAGYGFDPIPKLPKKKYARPAIARMPIYSF